MKLPVTSLRVSSIRKQLLLWLLIPIVALGLIGSVITYYIGIDFANEAYDESLADSARALASRVYLQKEHRLTFDLPPVAMAFLVQDDDDKFFYRIIGPTGKMIAGDDEFPAPPESGTRPVFQNGRIHGEKVRIATLRVKASEMEPAEIVTIQVAETYQNRKKLINEILTSVVFLQLSLILLAAGSVWFGVTRGLRPLEKVRQAVLSRTPKDLSPLREAEAPPEVRPLIHAINDLLARLAADIAIQKRFLANAAHQLRTPLAGLKTQTELARRLTRPEDFTHSLGQIQTSVDRTVHLSRQLLSLARVEPGATDPTAFTTLDLGEVVRGVMKELVSQAIHKDIDLGYDGDFEELPVRAESVSIRELVSNLIENAVRYTPSGGRVTVQVKHQENRVNLFVEDNGPGIPAEERPRVFERFYRVLGTGEDGSGLGLSIVHEIAEAHQASVTLSEGPDGTGTRVSVSFPALNRESRSGKLHSPVAAG